MAISSTSFKKGHTVNSGRIPWNKGMRGVIKMSILTKKKMSKSHKKIGTPWLIGRVLSVETKRKLSDKLSGENSPTWKGGRTSFKKRLREASKYKKWRKEVFERDNFTCQICGKRGLKLNADHIYAFSMILTKYNIDTVEKAFICADLWNISNGRTLCVSCHRNTPNFGRPEKAMGREMKANMMT